MEHLKSLAETYSILGEFQKKYALELPIENTDLVQEINRNGQTRYLLVVELGQALTEDQQAMLCKTFMEFPVEYQRKINPPYEFSPILSLGLGYCGA